MVGASDFLPCSSKSNVIKAGSVLFSNSTVVEVMVVIDGLRRSTTTTMRFGMSILPGRDGRQPQRNADQDDTEKYQDHPQCAASARTSSRDAHTVQYERHEPEERLEDAEDHVSFQARPSLEPCDAECQDLVGHDDHRLEALESEGQRRHLVGFGGTLTTNITQTLER